MVRKKFRLWCGERERSGTKSAAQQGHSYLLSCLLSCLVSCLVLSFALFCLVSCLVLSCALSWLLSRLVFCLVVSSVLILACFGLSSNINQFIFQNVGKCLAIRRDKKEMHLRATGRKQLRPTGR